MQISKVFLLASLLLCTYQQTKPIDLPGNGTKFTIYIGAMCSMACYLGYSSKNLLNSPTNTNSLIFFIPTFFSLVLGSFLLGGNMRDLNLDQINSLIVHTMDE